jgi:predicted metal-dependent hydrolase
MTETLEISGLLFEVRRSDRRKTLGLTVDRGGELIAHTPLATSAEELARWITSKLLWVHRKLALKEEAAPRMHAPEYVSGEAFCYLGRPFSLKVVPKQGLPLHFDGTRFTLRRDARPAEHHFGAGTSTPAPNGSAAESQHWPPASEPHPQRLRCAI